MNRIIYIVLYILFTVEILSQTEADSTGNFNEPRWTHVLCELTVSPAAGIAAGIGTGYLVYSLSDTDIPALLAGYGAFLAGSSLSTYLIAQNTSKDVKFGATLFASTIGAGIGIVFSALIHSWTGKTWGAYATLIFPVVYSAVHVNVLAPDKKIKSDVSAYRIPERGHLTAADHYNSTMSFHLDLLKIYF